MRFLQLLTKLVFFVAMSCVALATTLLGISMNQHGLASALAKEPADSRQFMQPLWEAFTAETWADWLATGMTLMMFVGIWFVCHEALNARHLARERGNYTRAGDPEKAEMARMVMRDARGWALLLAVPIGILLGVDYYLLSRYAEVEQVWMNLGIALIGPLMWAYLWDRAAIAWDALRSLGAEYWAPTPGANLVRDAAPVVSEGRTNEPATASAPALDRPTQESVQIDVSTPEPRVPRAEHAEFSWSITGARSAILDAPARGERMAAPLNGRLVLTAPLEEEAFDLTAIGPDGSQKTRRLRVIPRGLAINEPLQELKFLTAPWH